MAECKVNKSKAVKMVIIYHPNPEAVSGTIEKIKELAAQL